MLYKALILLINLVIPLFIGAFSSYLSMDTFAIYLNLNKPPLSPPGSIFPIVWTILYILMGIASFLIINKKLDHKITTKIMLVYALSLLVNFMWSIIFFRYNAYLFAFVWLIILWLLILTLIIMYFKYSKPAALLLVPYLFWVTFAGYLNYMTYLLN